MFLYASTQIFFSESGRRKPNLIVSKDEECPSCGAETVSIWFSFEIFSENNIYTALRFFLSPSIILPFQKHFSFGHEYNFLICKEVT